MYLKHGTFRVLTKGSTLTALISLAALTKLRSRETKGALYFKAHLIRYAS